MEADMTQHQIALVLERLSIDELATGCTVTREWVIEHVEAGALEAEAGPDPGSWSFSGSELLRARQLLELERDFDANPELAGLVADLFGELHRLRTRLRRAGLSPD
jgi:chaperone modulatory protein CbpM